VHKYTFINLFLIFDKAWLSMDGNIREECFFLSIGIMHRKAGTGDSIGKERNHFHKKASPFHGAC
jgi:hypothetical protein